MPELHSLFGPSGASRWMTCSGSIHLGKDLPNESSVYAEEGTAGHSLGEWCLRHGFNCDACLGMKFNGFVVDEAMTEHVQVFVDFCRLKASEHPDAVMQLEVRILAPWDERFGGTVDCLIRIPSQNLLIVIDLKYGAGVPVEVADNKQLLSYGLLAWQGEETIENWIVQPRCEHEDGPLRGIAYPASAMAEFRTEIEKAIANVDALQNTPALELPLATGDHCRWCKALAHCPQQRKEVLDEALKDFTPVEETAIAPIGLMDSNHVAFILDRRKQIIAYLKAVDDLALSEALSGRPIAGYKLVQALSNSRLSVDEATIVKALRTKKIKKRECFETPKLKSATQLKKLAEVRAGKGWIDQFITRDVQAPKIVPVSDKRQEYALPNPADDFTVLPDMSFLS